MVTRGFTGRRQAEDLAARTPPGQYLTTDFPVLTVGPTPRVEPATWSFSLTDGGDVLASWRWDEFQALPQSEMIVDIHCVTTWSKLGTRWEGVSIDTLFEHAGIDRAPPGAYVMAESYGGYTTNVPVADLVGGRAMVATRFDGQPLAPEHGGPARLLVPHLYFWKSAKWVRSLGFMADDAPGFWEVNGYHMYADPWREQRYSGD